MSTAVLNLEATVHKESPTDIAADFRVSIASSVDAAIERIVAAAPPLSQAQRDRLATILGGGA